MFLCDVYVFVWCVCFCVLCVCQKSVCVCHKECVCVKRQPQQTHQHAAVAETNVVINAPVEVREWPQVARPVARITVDGVEALVVLNRQLCVDMRVFVCCAGVEA